MPSESETPFNKHRPFIVDVAVEEGDFDGNGNRWIEFVFTFSDGRKSAAAFAAVPPESGGTTFAFTRHTERLD